MTERENALQALRHQEPEWVPALFECTVSCRDVINSRPIFDDGQDCFGVTWKRSGPETNYITHVDLSVPPVLEDVTQWREKVHFPDLSAFDWEAAAVEITDEMRREKIIYCIVGLGLLERVTTLMRYEDALCAFLEEPEAMYDLCGAIADHKIELIDYIARYQKPDVINYHDDWAMQTGPFLPKHVWEEIIKPHTQRIYDAVKGHGITLLQHSCGKVESYLPDIIEMGADGWNSCQDCNDLAYIKKTYGDKLVLVGALDDQNILGRPDTTEEMLRAEAQRKVDMLAPGGGWICGPNAYVSFDFDQDRACDSFVREYSRAFYAKRK